MTLSPEENNRYSRHLLLPEIGIEGQEKLKAARVLVVGAGGLGCPVLLYLTAAGIGNLGIIDGDVVDKTNLQRQILYTEKDIGLSKVSCAKKHLQSLNSDIEISIFNEQLTASNALSILQNYDIVVDGSDNFATRYLVNDACVISKKPFVYGAIHRFSGQISVFNYNDGPTYRCLYSQPPAPGEVPSCGEIGVIGVLPGIVGSLQANEVIKMVTGIGEVCSGKLLLFDALTLGFRKIAFKKNPETAPVTSLIDYDVFCNGGDNADRVKEISPEEFLRLKNSEQAFQLIDVREQNEYNRENINGLLISLRSLVQRINEIATDKMVVVHCQSGARSSQAVKLLQERYGFEQVYNLTGGLNALKKL